MKKALFTLLLTLSVTAMTAQSTLPAPAVSFNQITRLWRGENPDVVLKGLGLKKFWYNYCEDAICCCTYGRHIKYENICQVKTPLADDAYGITYCDAGPGCWDIVFKNHAIAEAYRKDIVVNGYTPVFEQWQTINYDDGSTGKYLEYIENFDEGYCSCVRFFFNGDYYSIRIASEPQDELAMFWLRQLPALKDAPMKSYLLENYRLKDMTYTSDGHTYYHYGHNVDYNNETLEMKILGPDAMFIDYSCIRFSNKKLMKLYVDEANMLGYQPMDSLGWKDIDFEGKVIGKEMSMYKNQDGLWGGYYGDVIRFLCYDDFCQVMVAGSFDDECPEATRQPAITIADLEQLASGKTTLDALKQKIKQAGQDGELEIQGVTIKFKDKKFLGSYELEARELGYNVKREEGKDGWSYASVGIESPSLIRCLSLYKGRSHLFFTDSEDEGIELSLMSE